jgi:hypothetical protein
MLVHGTHAKAQCRYGFYMVGGLYGLNRWHPHGFAATGDRRQEMQIYCID